MFWTSRLFSIRKFHLDGLDSGLDQTIQMSLRMRTWCMEHSHGLDYLWFAKQLWRARVTVACSDSIEENRRRGIALVIFVMTSDLRFKW